MRREIDNLCRMRPRPMLARTSDGSGDGVEEGARRIDASKARIGDEKEPLAILDGGRLFTEIADVHARSLPSFESRAKGSGFEPAPLIKGGVNVLTTATAARPLPASVRASPPSATPGGARPVSHQAGPQ